MHDIIVTDMTRLPSCIVKWFYHLNIKKDIIVYPLKNNGKEGTLYRHGSWNPTTSETQAVLILHGLHSHPFVMLHLAEMARKVNIGPVYTLYVTYDQENPESHRSLLKEAIQTIESYNSPLKGIVMVGHSMGAVEAAHTAFVERDKRISSVISIAGRLKLVDSLHSPCIEAFKITLDQIHQGVESLPELPLYQIVGRHDWNASLESTLVRQQEGCFHIVEAMHFNILFHRDIYTKFPEFLRKSIRL